MAEVLCSMLVDGDPTSVFDFVSSPEHRTVWQRDVQRSSQPMPQLAEGSSWTEVRRIGIHELRIDITITEACRPERITFTGAAGRYRGVGSLEFHAEGSRTRVIYRNSFGGRGLAAVAAPLLARQARHVAQTNLFRLRMHLAPVPQA